jgi:hypothetical protein
MVHSLRVTVARARPLALSSLAKPSMPTQLTGPEIADELFLSVNTVGTHTRHLNAKLGVHSRHDEVDRARARGLLTPSARRHDGADIGCAGALAPEEMVVGRDGVGDVRRPTAG